MALQLRAGVSPALGRQFCQQFRRPRGFTLVEAMVSITVLALAGAVLLLAVDSSLQTTTEAVDRTIADGLAQQLLDEITLQRFKEPGMSATGPLGPSGWEAGGSGRERYNDTDDYHTFEAQPAEGLWGEPLGTGNDAGGQRHAAFQLPANYFANWRQRIEVYFVDPADPSLRLTSGTSEYRGIEVHIEYVGEDGVVRPLATRKKVIAYVPPPTY
jgi:prepilin-type N-terminal cleavage/methylation domain-containing protein